MKMNYWKTSDIKLYVDSVGFWTAEHRWAGLLIDSAYYPTRKECRRDAVIVLRERKAQEESADNPFSEE